MTWSEMGEWWLTELEADPSYEEVITPMLLEILTPDPGALYLDLGCGEGRVMRTLMERGIQVHGIEMNRMLASRSSQTAPTIVAHLPDLTALRDDSYDGAYCVLVFEHVPDHRGFFAEAARVVRAGGSLTVLINHPYWTAPGSTPITDGGGEILWRPGEYFSEEFTDEPLGGAIVRFYHRPLGLLLNTAAQAGWRLEQMDEAPHHELEDQGGIPRLMAIRWSLLP